MDQLTSRVSRIKPSPTLAISAKAAELKASGQDIISLSLGEPDFDTPAHVIKAATEAMNSGLTHYTQVDGLPELKQAIQAKFKRDNQLDYDLNQILVSSGAKHSIFNLLQAVIEDGDEVLIPAPYWISYPDMVLLSGGTPVAVKADVGQHFKLSAAQLESAITPKTKLFMLNSPSNPTGMTYTKEELSALAEVLLKHPDILIMSDDIYEHIIWKNHTFTHLLNVCPELSDRTVVINGVSKAYAMTGWRIGYAAGSAKIIAAMKKIQSQSTSNPCSISQAAAIAALNPNEQDCLKSMVSTFKQRHDYMVTELNKTPGFHCLEAQGAFYAFPDITKAIKLKGCNDDLEFAEQLLATTGLAIVPGSAFGTPGCIRLSYAASDAVLADAIQRIKAFMA
jgi:aspartate aminotransferase